MDQKEVYIFCYEVCCYSPSEGASKKRKGRRYFHQSKDTQRVLAEMLLRPEDSGEPGGVSVMEKRIRESHVTGDGGGIDSVDGSRSGGRERTRFVDNRLSLPEEVIIEQRG